MSCRVLKLARQPYYRWSGDPIRDGDVLRAYLNQRRWPTRQDLRLAIVVWIERKHHRQRAQDALGGLTPIEFEAKQLAGKVVIDNNKYQLGFDSVDKSRLRESWRSAPGTPMWRHHVGVQSRAELTINLRLAVHPR